LGVTNTIKISLDEDDKVTHEMIGDNKLKIKLQKCEEDLAGFATNINNSNIKKLNHTVEKIKNKNVKGSSK